MHRVYLSGGMEYSSGEGREWRIELERWMKSELGHRVFNPNTESSRYFLKHMPGTNVRKLKERDTQAFKRLMRGIVDLDSRQIAYRTDYVICLWDRSARLGAGTKGELTIAKFFRKPVYLVTRQRAKRIPSWVLGCTTRIFGSFEQLKEFLLREFKG